jgi:hypothetical protein
MELMAKRRDFFSSLAAMRQPESWSILRCLECWPARQLGLRPFHQES